MNIQVILTPRSKVVMNPQTKTVEVRNKVTDAVKMSAKFNHEGQAESFSEACIKFDFDFKEE